MNLFKRFKKEPEKVPQATIKIIGIFTVKHEIGQIISSIGPEPAQLIDCLNKNESVYIIEDVNQEYFKVISRYNGSMIGYINKQCGTYILTTALPYKVTIVSANNDIVPIYDRPTANGIKVGMCYPKEVYRIDWELDNFGKLHDKPYWVNLDNVEKLRFK